MSNVKVAIVSSNLQEDVFGAVPLVDYFLQQDILGRLI
jgi:hypothetical protein